MTGPHGGSGSTFVDAAASASSGGPPPVLSCRRATAPIIGVIGDGGFDPTPTAPFAGALLAPRKVFQVQSDGTARLDIGQVRIDGTDPGDFTIVADTASNAQLAPSEMRLVTVAFRPGAAGARVATMHVPSNDNARATVDCLLRGRGTVGLIQVLPPAIDFTTVPLGAKPAAARVRLTNVGDAPLTITAAALTNAGTAQYTLAVAENASDTGPGGWPKTLGPAEYTDVPIAFEAKTAGVQAGVLNIASNAVGRPSVDVALTATVFHIKEPEFPPYLAARAETLEVKYKIDDPAAVITSGTFECFDAAKRMIFARPLLSAEYTHGQKQFDWNGAIGAGDPLFPDNCLTVEYSPYTWRVTVRTGIATATDPKVEKVFAVEVHTVSLELGPKTVLQKALHTVAYDTSFAAPVTLADATIKVKLLGNLFMTDAVEMNASSDKSFDEYRKIWGNGPLIPIYAKLTVKSSTGASVEAPLALGKVPILWDYVDEPNDLTTLHSRAKRFVTDAQERAKTATAPTGDNAHTDFGGHRGPASVAAFLAMHDAAEIQAFPFALPTPAGNRPWAVYTEALRAGAATVVGKTGVVFRPSRMAGDRWRVRIYVDIGKANDKRGALPAAAAQSGVFEIWRQVEVTKVFRKTTTITPYVHADVVPFYEKAFVELVNKAGPPALMANYDTRLYNAMMKEDASLAKLAVEHPRGQFALGKCGITVRTAEQFEAAVRAMETTPAKLTAFRAANRTTRARTTADITKLAGDAGVTNFVNRGYLHAGILSTNASTRAAGVTASEKLLANKIFNWSRDSIKSACNDMLADVATDGLVVFHFERAFDRFQSADLVLQGEALTRAKFIATNRLTRTKTGYIQFSPADSFAGGMDTLPRMLAHEFGHCLFLPHTKVEAGTDAAYAAECAKGHDADDDGCIMSYNFKVERNFCGYCLLRLRGWDHRKIQSSGPLNVVRPAIEITKSPRTFADVVVDETWVEGTLTLRNASAAALTISDITVGGTHAAEFTLADVAAAKTAVPANGTVTIKVTVKPQATTARSATVIVACSGPVTSHNVAIQCDALQLLPLLAAPAAVFTGTFSEVTPLRLLTAKSTGEAPLTISDFTIAGDDAASFAVEEAAPAKTTVAKNGEVSVKVRFKPPAVAAPKKTTLVIHSDAPVAQKKVALHSAGTMPVISVPPTLALGDVGHGKTITKVLKIENTGAAPLVVDTIVAGGPDGGDVTVVPAGPLAIAAGADQDVNVSYRCPAKGPKTAALMIASNAPTSPTLVAITAKGTLPELAVAYCGDYGSVSANNGNTFATFVLKNVGDGPFDITTPGLTLSGADVAHWALTASPALFPHTLAPGTEHAFTLTFRPTTAGPKSVTVTTSTDAPGGAQAFTPRGVGVAVPSIAVAPAGPLAFGSSTVGTATAAQVITVTNTGLAPLRLTAVTPSRPVFSVSGFMPRTVRPGGTVTFNVAFTPALPRAVTATITITSDAANFPNVVVNVTGTGTPRRR